ncbi:MAG: Cobalbumin biosynthesis protein [Methylococcaceae bacterium NSO1]|nr:MAG: Cobalbumin biosynthesis protein [Methylococcaceae bacterium NSO1]
MKTLFIGGVKSGKSRLAEVYILEKAGTDRPYYLVLMKKSKIECAFINSVVRIIS